MLTSVQSYASFYKIPKQTYFLQKEFDQLESGSVGRKSSFEKQRNILLLSVAYAASIGGTGVITGNPSNLVVLEVWIDFVQVFAQVWTVIFMKLSIDFPGKVLLG